MANQGCPNEGTDTRTFGALTCWLERTFSFRSWVEPATILVSLFPPFVAINIPLSLRTQKYFMARIGWRFDKHWPNPDPNFEGVSGPPDLTAPQSGFIFEPAAVKVLDHTTFY